MRQNEQAVAVSLGQDSYDILVDFNNLRDLGPRIKKFSAKGVVISNPTILSLYGDQVCKILDKAGIEYGILSIPEGEEYKSLEWASRLYDDLVEFGLQRGDFVMALGGGVIGDLSGFVAATYMRGVPFIQVPTTLLAQVDSSVGGKVAVNHRMGKNLIGCFYQPKLVQIDIATLKTLPDREFVAGMAEVIKCGFLIGEQFLSFLEMNLDSILKQESGSLVQAIVRCCSFKARVVEEDERDLGKRSILNYGHTFGHAIEAASDYLDLLHGEAISVGMVGAALISEGLGWTNKAFVDRHIRLLERVGLPTRIEGIDQDVIINRLALDKKGAKGAIRFVLLKDLGEPVLVEVSPKLIKETVSQLC